MDQRFTTMTVKEMAVHYFPHITCDAATKQLRKWIRQHAALYTQLLSTGYKRYNRQLTPKQVELIITHLG